MLRGDLNLQEVGKGRASPASNLLPIKTLAEVDFNSYRPADIVCCGAGSSQKTVTALDLATIGQSSGKPFWGLREPVPRGWTECPPDEELLRSNFRFHDKPAN